MRVKEAIEKRRSIRRYKDKPISDKIIKAIINAGILAPSGCNAQPWRFFVIKNKEVIRKLKAKKAFRQDFVYSAPVIIVCCGDPKSYIGKTGGEYQIKEGSIPGDEKTRKEWFKFLQGKENLRVIRDVAIASSFMVLRATELGLGTCFVGLTNEQVLRELLTIPSDFIIPFVLTVGHPAEKPKQRPRMKLNEIIFENNKNPLKEIRIELTQKCNLGCRYCYIEYLTKTNGKKEISFQEIKKVINEAMKQGLETVSLTGGEPFLRYDLVKKIIKFASDKGLKTGILTNAVLTNEDKIKELKKLGLDWIRISLDGSNEEINSLCRDRIGFNNIIDTIKISKKLGLYTIIRGTANRKNKTDLINLIKLAIKLNADRIDIQPIYPTKNKIIDKEFMLNVKEHKKTAANLLKFRRTIKNPIKIILYYNWFEFLLPEFQNEPVYMSSCGRTFGFVDAFGFFKTCGPNIKLLGNVRKENILKIWNESKFLKQLRKNGKYEICKTCDKFNLCLNSCPAATYNLHKDLKHSPPLCPRVRESKYGYYT